MTPEDELAAQEARSEARTIHRRQISEQPVAGPSLPILATKLYRPPITPDLDPRAHLIALLNRNRQRPLTLISAPAGSGKSILASVWLEHCDWRGAWVSLDERDSNLATFASYVLAALDELFPARLERFRAVLEAPNMPSPAVLARHILNDLAQIDEPFILVLDDFHCIVDPKALDLVNELLRYPPLGMHLVLISRYDPPLPIPSLRARRQMTEIRARDLRFSAQETQRLLEHILNRPVDEVVAAEWTDKTEGWVTAIRLAALSLRHRAPTASLTTDAPMDSHYLQEYLLAEVLAQQTPAIQAWLLKTSLLDRFCAPLAEAVCGGEDDMTGKEFIRWLQDSNLFAVPLDGQYEWFRFHHLFQQFLQNMLFGHLDPGGIDALHLRASNWLEQNGWLDEAIQQAVAGGDMAAAVRVVFQHRYKLMKMEQWHRLERWISMMPVETQLNDPVLLSTKGLVSIQRGEDKVWDMVLSQLELILPSLSPDLPEYVFIEGEMRLIRAAKMAATGQTKQLKTLVCEALELLPAEAEYARSVARLGLMVALQSEGQYKQCLAQIEAASDISTVPTGARFTAGWWYACIVLLLEGDLERLITTARDGLRLNAERRLFTAVSFYRYFLGVAHYVRNELDAAEAYLSALVEDPDLAAPSYLAQGLCVLALVYIALGQAARAEETLAFLRRHNWEFGGDFAKKTVAAFDVEIALRLGKLAEAQLKESSIDFNTRSPTWFFYVPQLTPVKLLLAQGGDEGLVEARAVLEDLDLEMGRLHRNAVRVDVLCLLALVHDAQGDTAVACDKLYEALALAERGGFVRNFVDLGPPMADLLTRYARQHAVQSPVTQHDAAVLRFLKRVVAAFPTAAQEEARTELDDALTQRELETIRLLATKMSPREIAAEMSVSVATVRSHTKNIYSKLDVHGRYEAVQRAKMLGLL